VSARYYAAKVDLGGNLREVPGPPCDTYDKAMDVHVSEIGRQAWPVVIRPRQNGKPDRRVLLDLGTVPIPGEIADVAAVLHNDPVLKAVFELGRRVGRREL
jgi:hypothetical protein